MATSKDVARLAGTSIATVSYVLNNGPRPVSDATREKVLTAADALGYKPNAAARALITGKTATFGLVVPSILNPFFGEFSHAFEKVSRRHEHLLLIADSDMDPLQERRHLEAFVTRGVDGVALVSCAIDAPQIETLTSRGVPVVALHPLPSHPDVMTVHMDYVASAEKLANHLFEIHEISSLLMILARGESGSAQHEEGIRSAAEKTSHHAAIHLLESEVSRANSYEGLIGHLEKNDLPEAIYCATDEQAYGALAALSKLGYEVPRDVRLVGFDGTLHSAYSTPPLTSVRQPLDEIATRSIELLLNLRERSGDDCRLPGELLIRKSCGC